MQEETDECTTLIYDGKEKYVRCMSNKFHDPLADLPLCIDQNLLVSTELSLNNKKIPAIPPQLVNDDIITNFF